MKVFKKDLYQFIKTMIASDSLWAVKAMRLVYSKQTEYEREYKVSCIDNGIGFSKYDAEIASSLVLMRTYTVRQLAFIRNMMKKYYKQVYDACDKDYLIDIYNTRNVEQLSLGV